MSAKTVYAVVDQITHEISPGDDVVESVDEQYALVEGVYWREFDLVPLGRIAEAAEIEACLRADVARLLKSSEALEERNAQLEEECKRLWALLDNISTAGDAYKPEHTPYFKYVNGECEKRDGLFYSDGYKILERSLTKDEHDALGKALRRSVTVIEENPDA